MPRERSHAFVVTSPTARFLTINTPAGFEDLFRTGTHTVDATVPAPGPRGEDLERARETLQTLGVTILGPPPEV